ncbi:Scr1 family TA system antitoxin-like transcriptional regulator [Nocardia asteroides]|nr:Scr1 family TA system antitoxin-like transcriptional regulator [Nocardia asteroides]
MTAAKSGSKIHLLSDRAGIPLSVAVSAANTNDAEALRPLVKAVPAVRSRRGPRRRKPAELHADKAYDTAELRQWVRDRGIAVRIARKGIESSQRLGRHRWVIERTISWLTGYHRLNIRYDRRPRAADDAFDVIGEFLGWDSGHVVTAVALFRSAVGVVGDCFSNPLLHCVVVGLRRCRGGIIVDDGFHGDDAGESGDGRAEVGHLVEGVDDADGYAGGQGDLEYLEEPPARVEAPDSADGLLRGMRQEAGLSIEVASRAIGCGAGTLHRLETGAPNVIVRDEDLRRLCRLYQRVDMLPVLKSLAAQGRTPSWLDEFPDQVNPTFNAYIQMEAAASRISVYRPDMVPGLFQVPDYARAGSFSHVTEKTVGK